MSQLLAWGEVYDKLLCENETHHVIKIVQEPLEVLSCVSMPVCNGFRQQPPQFNVYNTT